MFLYSSPNSTFRRNLLLNLLSALLVATLVLVLFSKMYTLFCEQEMKQRESSMRIELDHFTNELNSLANIFSRSNFSDSIGRIALLRGELRPSDYYALSVAQKYLSTLIAINNIAEDVVLVFSGSGIFMTQEIICLSEEEFIQQYRSTGFDGTFFMEESASRGQGHAFYPGGTFTRLTGTPRKIACIYRIPLGMPSVSETGCYAFLLVSYDQLMNSLLTDSMRRFGSLELYLESPLQTLSTYSAGDVFSKEGTLVSVNNGDHTLRADAYLPEGFFTSALGSVLNLVKLGILLVFGMGIFAAWIAAWRQSVPIRRLLADFKSQGMDVSRRTNEYEWLKENMQRINRECADISQMLEQHQRFMRNNMLERLFDGVPMSPEKYEHIERELARLPRPFIVGLAKFRPGSTVLSQSARDMRTVFMQQELVKLLPSGSELCTFDAETMAVLVPCPEGRDREARAIESRFTQLSAFGARQIVLTFGMPLTQVKEIPASFSAILVCAEDAFAQSSVVHCVDELSGDADFTFRDLQQYYGLLVNGNIKEARQALRNYFHCSSRQCGTMHQRFYTARTLTELAADAVGIDVSTIQYPHFDISDDSHSMTDKYDALLTIFSAQMDALHGQSRDRRIQDILKYIDEHFTQGTCCPGSIAAAFYISEKHLYALLKEKSNTTPAVLLLERRLAYAAKLLVGSRVSAQMISEQAGFANFNTFYKAFKRLYGLSPTQYRESAASHT